MTTATRNRHVPKKICMSAIKLAPPKLGRDLSSGNSAREANLQDHHRRFDEIHVVS
jgi:hypothetical protein